LPIGDDPLGLDGIAARLGVSKTGSSVATRDLERLGVVRRLGTTSRQSSKPSSPIFSARTRYVPRGGPSGGCAC